MQIKVTSRADQVAHWRIVEKEVGTLRHRIPKIVSEEEFNEIENLLDEVICLFCPQRKILDFEIESGARQRAVGYKEDS